MSNNYHDIQSEEARTWLIEDPTLREEKARREMVRYPWMAKQMGLNNFDTSDMVILDIGAGPLGGVSSVLPNKDRILIDPLKDEYAKYFDVTKYHNTPAENAAGLIALADLIIVTNALDHFEAPATFMSKLVNNMKPGAFFSHYHASWTASLLWNLSQNHGIYKMTEQEPKYIYSPSHAININKAEAEAIKKRLQLLYQRPFVVSRAENNSLIVEPKKKK
jgi:2-polyprenyl-3-methyl-5-hydroxy-6-metoxy-1,4-benzoquinol methylase